MPMGDEQDVTGICRVGIPYSFDQFGTEDDLALTRMAKGTFGFIVYVISLQFRRKISVRV
jgi:hypothetical protein